MCPPSPRILDDDIPFGSERDRGVCVPGVLLRLECVDEGGLLAWNTGAAITERLVSMMRRRVRGVSIARSMASWRSMAVRPSNGSLYSVV